VIHTHEEAVFIGALYAYWFRLPHLYDMHSSLPQQFDNWGVWYASLIAATGRILERWALSHSTVVVTICQALADHVRTVAPHTVQILIENVPSVHHPTPDYDRGVEWQHFHLDGILTVVYTGNFEPYQGIDLLLRSFVHVHRVMPQARLFLVGGESSAIKRYRHWTATHGLAGTVVFTGLLPPELTASYLAMADVLVSARVSGTNTPLKLGAYLHAGKAVVATDLPTHTQLLTPDVALLAKAEPEAFAQALLLTLTDRELRLELGRRARAFADERFSAATYRQRVTQAYQLLLGNSA
jgi:glycosyltransferase involved in cell wall biosynthesis